MKLVVGLGNPGEKYEHNRHNVGFVVVDKLSTQYAVRSDQWKLNKKFESVMIQTDQLIIAKPQTFMNESGRAVGKIKNFYKIELEDIFIVHDDLDIPLGNYKIQHAKGPRVHYGVNSVEREVGSEDFWRVRIGVENRPVRGNTGVPGEVYSLQDFDEAEAKIVSEVMTRVATDLLTRLG